jgi:hypothetical protein
MFLKLLTKNVQIIEGSLLKRVCVCVCVCVVTARRYKRCPYSHNMLHMIWEKVLKIQVKQGPNVCIKASQLFYTLSSSQ